MGGRKAKTRPRRPTSLEQARNTVAGLEAWLHIHLEGLNLPTNHVELIFALQKLDEDSPLAELKDSAYCAVIYLEMMRDEIDPLNTDPDHLAAMSHIAMATALIEAVKVGREKIENRRQQSAAAIQGARVRASRYAERRLALTGVIDRRILTDPSKLDSAIADELSASNRDNPPLNPKNSTLRRWIRDRRAYLQSVATTGSLTTH